MSKNVEKVYCVLENYEPIIHFEIPPYKAPKVKGAALKFNRINVTVPLKTNGKVIYKNCMVPGVSGNSTRGQTRRPFMLSIFDTLEIDANSVHPDVIFWLAGGGSTGKGDTVYFDLSLLQKIRTVLPFADLMGGSLRALFLKGKLRSGFVLPLVKETYHLAPQFLQDKFSLYDLMAAGVYESESGADRLTMHEIGFTRMRLNDEFAGFSSGVIEMETDAEESDEDDKKEQAIFRVEYLPAGMTLFNSFSVLNPKKDPILRGAFHAFVDTFADNGLLGGGSAKGFGGVTVKVINEDGSPYVSQADNFWDHVKADKSNIKTFMTGDMTDFIKGAEKKKEEAKIKAAEAKAKAAEAKKNGK